MSDKNKPVIFEKKEIQFDELDKGTQEKYQNLADKIAGQSSAFEECESEWRPAILKLVHPVTDDPKMPEGAKPGDYFFDGGLLKRPCNLVVAYAYPTRANFKDEQGLVCTAERVDLRGRNEKDTSVSIYGDKCAECPFDDQPFRHGKPTDCNNQMNVIVIPEDLREIFLIRFSKSSWTVGNSLVDMAKATPGNPWNRFFALDSKLESRDKGSGKFAVPVVTSIDAEKQPVPDHLKAFAEFVSEQVKEFRKVERDKVLQRANEISGVTKVETIDGDDDDDDYSDGM